VELQPVITPYNAGSAHTIFMGWLNTLPGVLKEGWQRSVLGKYHRQKQALSRFAVGAMLQTEPVLDVIRRELRRLSPDVRIDTDQIKAVLSNEVIKRDVMEGEKAEEARKKIARVVSKALRTAATKSEAKNAEGAARTQVDMAEKA
jgi:hypothetical protein